MAQFNTLKDGIKSLIGGNQSFSGISKTRKESPLQRQGNKRTLIDSYQPYFPKTDKVKRFIDAFGGSGTVGLNTNYRNTIINDKDKNIYSLLNTFKNTKADDVVNHINSRHKQYNLLTEAGWNSLRDAYNSTNEKERNPLDLYLLRETSSRPQLMNYANNQYTGKYGNGGNANRFISDIDKLKKQLEKSYYKMQHIDFQNRDAMDLIKEAQEGDFIYLDPPYTNTKAEYNRDWSSENDNQLFNLLDEATKRGVLFALSNAANYRDKTGQLIENAPLKEWAKKYNMYNFDKYYNGAKSDDVLITNYKGEI